MKLFLLLVITTMTASKSFARIDCATANIQYRKSTQTYSNTILKQWACAAVMNVAFEDRDSNPLVKSCEKSTVLYKEVGASSDSYCIRLDDKSEGTADFLLVKLVDGTYIPEYQATEVESDDLN